LFIWVFIEKVFPGHFTYTLSAMPDLAAHGKRKNLGRFANPADAARAYDQAAKRIFLEFAVTNFAK